MVGIYKITNPKGNIYIGRSFNIEKRFSRYKSLNCKSQLMLYRSLLKYGVENHSFDIITIGDYNNELLNELEIHYIRLYDSFNKGLNLTEGGKGMKGFYPTVETRKKLSDSKKGKTYRKGKPHTSKAKKQIGLLNGKKVINTETGEVYNSGFELSKIIGVNYNTLNCWLNGQRKNKSKFKYI